MRAHGADFGYPPDFSDIKKTVQILVALEMTSLTGSLQKVTIFIFLD
jgi:hypothetical protein